MEMFRKLFPTQIYHFHTYLKNLKNNYYLELFNSFKNGENKNLFQIFQIIHVICQNAPKNKCNSFMMFSKPFDQYFIDTFSEVHKTASPKKRGMFSLFRIIMPMNPSNPLSCLGLYHIALTGSCIHIARCIDAMS